MSVIAVIPARELHDDVAPTTHTVGEQRHIYAVSGFIVDECTLVCPECFQPPGDEETGIIHCNDEWDSPGHTCEDCGRWLDVSLLVYEQGPGSHIDDELVDEYRL